jgi:hypothetical protein
MKLSKNNLSEIIQLYLNDIEDYGDTSDLVLAESVLNPLKSLILESKTTVKDLLLETYNKGNSKQQSVISDFTLYCKYL